MTEQELLQLAKKAGFDFQGKGNTQWTRPYEYCELAFYRFADYVSEHLSAALAAAQEREAKLVEALEEIVSARTVTASPQQLAHELQRIASAVLSQSSHEQARQADVPEGYKLVPIEPTEEMLQLGEKELGLIDTRWDEAPMWDVWYAMIAAAPSGKEGE